MTVLPLLEGVSSRCSGTLAETGKARVEQTDSKSRMEIVGSRVVQVEERSLVDTVLWEFPRWRQEEPGQSR